MTELQNLAHFLYGRGFWYADPLKEIDGLKDEHLFWIPDSKSMCTFWHVGHIAHRERWHIGGFLQGKVDNIIPPEFEVFGTKWSSVENIKKSIDSVESVLEWVREVRQESHNYIDNLSADDFDSVPETSKYGYSIAHWLFITTAHTALHIGIIQHLRALIEGTHERAC